MSNTYVDEAQEQWPNEDSGPLCLGCHVDAELDSDGYCADCNDENDEL